MNPTLVSNETPQGRPAKMEYLLGQEFQAALKDAVVVMGICEKSGNKFLAYGKANLEAIVKTGITKPMLCVNIYQDTVELEALLAAVLVAKGRHEYGDGRDAGRGPLGLTDGLHRLAARIKRHDHN